MLDENFKTLLVIGNGFDIAHGLKTGYTDFLDNLNKRIGTLWLTDKNLNMTAFRNFKRRIQFALHKDDKFLYPAIDAYTRSTFGNIWLAYFNEIRENENNRIGQNWLDFEREIEDVIQKIEKLILGNISDVDKGSLSKIMCGYLGKTNRQIIDEYIPKLNFDLEVLTLLLERYLIDEQKKLVAKPLPIIKKIPNVTAVISYNYTDTWKKIYGADGKVKTWFIHGELTKHNLVLGINETLDKKTADEFTVCAGFKKFFQRVKYKLGNDYRNIIQPKSNSNRQVVVYGHSLAANDKDSLRWLMKNSAVKRIIVYHFDEETHHRQIANAIQIIGKDKLIEDVNSGRIIFKSLD